MLAPRGRQFREHRPERARRLSRLQRRADVVTGQDEMSNVEPIGEDASGARLEVVG